MYLTLKNTEKPVSGKRKRRATRFAEANKRKPTKAVKEFKKLLTNAGIGFQTEKVVYTKCSFYLMDFFVPIKMLCIELDGGYHTEEAQKEYDEKRDAFMVSEGYQVWRMTNEDAGLLTVSDIKAKIAEYPDVLTRIKIAATADEPAPRYTPMKHLPKKKRDKGLGWRAKKKAERLKRLEERKQIREATKRAKITL